MWNRLHNRLLKARMIFGAFKYVMFIFSVEKHFYNVLGYRLLVTLLKCTKYCSFYYFVKVV